jgi:hypothetical protein
MEYAECRAFPTPRVRLCQPILLHEADHEVKRDSPRHSIFATSWPRRTDSAQAPWD